MTHLFKNRNNSFSGDYGQCPRLFSSVDSLIFSLSTSIWLLHCSLAFVLSNSEEGKINQLKELQFKAWWVRS